MSEKLPFKLGLTLGPRNDVKEIKIDQQRPDFAVNQANRAIHENYGPGISLFLVDENNGNRRRTRRRQ